MMVYRLRPDRWIEKMHWEEREDHRIQNRDLRREGEDAGLKGRSLVMGALGKEKCVTYWKRAIIKTKFKPRII